MVTSIVSYSIKFTKGFFKSPFTQWRRTLAQIELKTGRSTLWASPTRAVIRFFERKYLAPLPEQNKKKIGNYYIHRDTPYDRTSIVYSAGVGTNITFDLEISALYSPQIHLIDPTPNSIQFVESQSLPANFIYHPVALSDHNGQISFYPDYNKDDLQRSSSFSIYNRSGARNKLTVPCLTLKSLMAQNHHDHIDLLKMDIEGAASLVLLDALNDDIRPQQIICEFEMPANPIKLFHEIRRLKHLFRLMKHHGYRVYSITDILLGTRIEIVGVLNT